MWLLCLGFINKRQHNVFIWVLFILHCMISRSPPFPERKKKKKSNLASLIFHGWVIVHCIHIPHSLYPLIHWWASRLISWLLVIMIGVIMNVTVPLSPDPWFLTESKSEGIVWNGHACYPPPTLGPWLCPSPCTITLSPFLDSLGQQKAPGLQPSTTKSKLHPPCLKARCFWEALTKDLLGTPKPLTRPWGGTPSSESHLVSWNCCRCVLPVPWEDCVSLHCSCYTKSTFNE